MKSDSGAILDILGNETRRNILAALSVEPMYFNQLAKEIDIGQQAMIRHLLALEKTGLIETYAEKSTFGAPNRKYYKLSSSFSLTISLSADDFVITNQKIKESRHRDSKKYYKKLDSIPETTGEALSFLQDSLSNIDEEITNLEFRLSDLRALRQHVLRKLYQIGVDKFDKQERKVLYMLVKESPKTFAELSELVDEKESDIRRALTGMKGKMNDGPRHHHRAFHDLLAD